jgi:enoyl-CoA hydratase/carnithine racemase
MARAKLVVLLCDRLDAARAERLGLLNAAVADDALDATVDEWARRLGAKPSWAVHMTKTQFQAYGRSLPMGDVTAGDGDLLAAATSEDPSRFAMPPKR